MQNIYKKLILGLIVVFTINFAVAQQQPATFDVQVEPSSFDTNVWVDITIKALNSNWDIIKDYEWDIFIDVEWSLDILDYVVPSQAMYTFVPQDQWVKTFSKWLIIKKAGTFNLIAEVMSDESIKWSKTIIVWSNASISTKKIEINSPVKDGIEKTEFLEVIWWNSDLANSPFEIYLNNQQIHNGMTSSVWWFTSYVSWLVQWQNTLSVKILDANGVVLWESDIIPFSYLPISDDAFHSIQVMPWNNIKAGSKVTFKVSTNDTVTSSTIKLSNWRSAPMDLVSAWTFSKEILIDTEGKIDVSLDLLVAWEKKEYKNVSRLIVEKGTKIGKVRVFWDSVYKNKLTLTREVDWTEPSKYNVTFGSEENNLNESAIVTKKEIILEDLTIWKIYFFRIVPLDANWENLGSASDVVQATIWDISESLCTVQWITINETKIWDRYYLTWNEVNNIEKYIIYRSERPTSDVSKMQKVTEVTENRFEYPFNKSAKKDKFAYFAVQAICKDGKALIIQDVKKIQTWPVENFLLFIFIVLFWYSSYRLAFIEK